jgi:dynein heavy chain
VSDVFIFIGEIQRTWSYLEPLFIGSDEVKRELPEDAKRFEGIDINVKNELKTCWEMKNVDRSCNQTGLLHRLENIQEQLEICKKSLSDFLDGRRRQFPRFFLYVIIMFLLLLLFLCSIHFDFFYFYSIY